jgi:DNA-binding transcriptional ArsR family regulator
VCVSAIAELLDMSVATASHHLQSLSEAGFLEPKREGKRVCYVLIESGFNSDLKNFICRNRKSITVSTMK